MFNHITKIAIVFVLASALVAPKFVFSQDASMEAKCLILTQSGCSLDSAACKKELEACMNYYDQESNRVANDMQKTSQEKKTLQNKISGLNSKIKELNYNIGKNNLIIKDLKIQITDTEGSIEKNTQKIEELRVKLADVLRSVSEQDKKSLIEVMFAQADLSSFFDNLVGLEIIGSKNKDLLQDIKLLKASLEGQKVSLDGEKEDLEKTVKLHEQQKQESDSVKKSQEQYLKMTEAEYQKQLSEKQEIEKKAAQIRAKLFQLVGVSKAPTFGEALEVAKSVAAVVGIRPALLLAIISQESAIGRNVGQCVLADSATGTGKKISTGASVSRLMKVSRDVQPFLSITAALGRDPYNTPVSCPLSIGYGGAMGPAQFIPSTWNLYTSKLQSILGKAGDPWAIKDSFTASALYLYDLGAGAKTYAKESNAASRYYGGSSSYAKSVMTRAGCVQDFIDTGDMSNYCQGLIF